MTNNNLGIRILILFLALLPATAAQADDITMDHLEAVNDCINDATRLDEGRLLADSLLATANIASDPLYAQLLYLKTHYYINSGQFAQAKTMLLDMLTQLDNDGYAGQELTVPNDLAICLPHDIGLCYRREGQNDSALVCYDQALQAATARQDMEWQAAINHNIGVMHYNLNHLQEAERYLDKAIELVQQVDDPYTELCALQVGSAMKLKLEKYDEARRLMEPAYRLAIESESPDWMVRCLTTMLAVYDHLQMPDSTAATLRQADNLLPLLPPHSITTIGFLTARGNYYMGHALWQQAAADLQTVLDSDMSGVGTYEGFSHLATCYEHLNQWQQAYRYKDSAAVCAAREAEQQYADRLAEFNARYQTMEKDLQISRLEARQQRLVAIIVAAVIVGILILLGLWLWQRQRRFRRIAQLRISTLEEERARIARELHDGLCNDLLALEMQCASGVPPSETSARLSTLRQQARTLSHQLMPPAFDHLTLQELLRLFTRQLHDDTGFDVSFSDTTAPGTSFAQDTALELYRIVQEHTANIIKGGTATHIGITLSDRRLSIADNGITTAATEAQGVGHRTISDRALNIGATLDTTPDSTLNESEPLNFLNIILP